MAHLSDVVIYPLRLPVACKLPSILVVLLSEFLQCSLHTNVHSLREKKSVAVIKGLCCCSCSNSSRSSSVGLTMAKADPQVGAPKSLTPPDLPGTKLLKGHYCRLPAESKTGTMRECFSLLLRIFPLFASPERMWLWQQKKKPYKPSAASQACALMFDIS